MNHVLFCISGGIVAIALIVLIIAVKRSSSTLPYLVGAMVAIAGCFFTAATFVTVLDFKQFVSGRANLSIGNETFDIFTVVFIIVTGGTLVIAAVNAWMLLKSRNSGELRDEEGPRIAADKSQESSGSAELKGASASDQLLAKLAGPSGKYLD